MDLRSRSSDIYVSALFLSQMHQGVPMKLNKFISIIALAFSSLLIQSNAIANGASASDAVIEKIQINDDGNQIAVMRLNKLDVDGPCTNGHHAWHFGIRLDTPVGKEQYSMALSAMVAGKKIDIAGYGNSNDCPYGMADRVYAIQIKN